MCTVTFVPVNDNYFLTSNRDEKSSRGQAKEPEIYQHANGNSLIYPRDSDSGGTWIALGENGNAAVLLNGGFEKHISAAPYRKSRGIIFQSIIQDNEPVSFFNEMDLHGIEPFTLAIFESQLLFECRWTGEKKFCRQLKNTKPYIWSSVTLYSPEIIRERENWFGSFLNKHPHPTQQDILNFHRFAGNNDVENKLVMCRGTAYKTVSVTGIHLTTDRGSMKYLDMCNDLLTEKKIEFNRIPQVV